MSKEWKVERRVSRYWWVAIALVALLIPVLAAGGNSASADTSYDSEELRFLQLINEYRQQNGVGPLILSDTLTVSSEHHSLDMAKYGFFGHNTEASSYYPKRSQPWDRMAADGYTYNTFKGENLAVGYETAEATFQGWRESPSHNAAMLDGNYRVIGIARIYSPGGNHHWYWTTDFGGYVDPTSHAPGEFPQAQELESPPAEPPHEKKPSKDQGGMENGSMNTQSVWKQEARDGADLILEDGYARLGGYDDGTDDLSQKIRVGKEARLAYGLRIETEESRNPSDRLLVLVTNEEGKRIDVLKRYTDEDAGEWRRPKVDLSRFAGRIVYLSFHVETDGAQLTTYYLDNVVLNGG